MRHRYLMWTETHHFAAETVFGLRDRAMLETFNSTGIRRRELVRLEVADIDRQRETLLVRSGKGRKDRVVQEGAL